MTGKTLYKQSAKRCLYEVLRPHRFYTLSQIVQDIKHALLKKSAQKPQLSVDFFYKLLYNSFIIALLEDYTIMASVKKFVALLLCMAVILGFAACRSKDESALIYGNLNASKGDAANGRIDIRSALYILYNFDAVDEFKEKVNETTTTGESTSDIEYEAAEVDDKSYDEWVEARTVEKCAEYAYVELQFDQLQLSFEEDELQDIDDYVEWVWEDGASYGYRDKTIYEANGVSLNTLKAYYRNYQKRLKLFDYYYDEDGSKALSEASIKEYMDENYVLVNNLSYSFTNSDGSTVSDEDKSAKKTLFEGYQTRLENGESFATIKAEYDQLIAEEQGSTTTTTTTSAAGPKDPNGSIYGSENTQYASDDFNDIHAMKNGEVKIFETDSAYLLVVRRNILDDSYYYDNLLSTLRHEMKDDEFDQFISEEAANLDFEKNNGAINYYTPDKLIYTTQS